MAYNEDPLSHQKSMGLIEEMISAAKDQHNEGGEGWLIWGWVLFIASTLSVIFLYIGTHSFVGIAWLAALPVGGGFYLAFKLRKRKSTTVKTYISTVLKRIEAGFFISLLAMILGGNIDHWQQQYGYFLFGFYFILYAFWMYIHGSITRFKPLIIGAFINWAAALAIFFVHDLKYIMMISAVAVLAGYIIPGYIQRHQFIKNYGTRV